MKNTVELPQSKMTNVLSLKPKADCARLDDAGQWQNCKKGQY